MDDEKSKLLQQRYIELQILEQQIKEVRQQEQILNQQLMELTKLKESLSDLEKTNKGKELLSQIGARVFLRAELKDNKNVLIGVGANVVVEKSVEEANKIITMQLEEIEKNIQIIHQHIISASDYAKDIHEELIKLQKNP